MNKLTLLLLCCMLPICMPAQAQSTRVVGHVQDATTQRPLYTELHDQVLAPDGSVQTELTTYLDPNGKEIGRKTLDFRRHRTVPIYRLDLPTQGYAEGIRNVGIEANVFKLDQGREKAASLPVGTGLVAADSGFNQLLLDQMPALRSGKAVDFKLIVAGNTDSYSFQARKSGETTIDGEAALRIRVEPASVLRWLVDPIELIYNTSGTRLIRYEGVSNLFDPATSRVYKRILIQYSAATPTSSKPPSSSPTTVR